MSLKHLACSSVWVLLLFGCSNGEVKPPFPQPRLVILYATCTVNANYLSPYDSSISFTPNISEFSKSATVFTKHHSESGQSGIAFASIFTGTQADRHGIYYHPTKLSDDQYLIAEAYAERGYDTYFWNGHSMASVKLGYGQGIVPAHNFEDTTAPYKGLQAGDDVLAQILERLEADPSYGALLVTNFSTTHGPYLDDNLARFVSQHPREVKGLTQREIKRYGRLYRENRLQLQWNFPETVARLKLNGDEIGTLAQVVELLYKSRIHELDTVFGELVDEIARHDTLDQSLIVFTADHGEILYREHSPFKWEHGLVTLPETLRVPLIIRGPLGPPGPSRWEHVTRSVDVFPTMLGLSNLPQREDNPIAGIDLSDAIRGLVDPPSLLAFSHTTTMIPSMREQRRAWSLMEELFPSDSVELIWTAVREEDLFVRWRHFGDEDWRFEAFDLEVDPYAAIDIFDFERSKHEELAKRLREYKGRLVRSFEDSETSHGPDDTSIRRLRALGYVE